MTFADISDRWREEILPMKKAASQRSMTSHIRVLNREFGHREAIVLPIQKVFSELSRTRGPATVKSMWVTFHTVMSYARNEKFIVEMPEKPVLPRVPRRPQRWLTIEDMRRIVQSLTGTHKAIAWTLSETGLRQGEVFCLTVGNLDFNNSTLTVTQSVFAGQPQLPKTDTSLRTICMSTHLSELLRNEVGERKQGYVFAGKDGKPRSYGYALSLIRNKQISLGIEPSGMHAFRRGSASIFSQIGCPERLVSHRLGHVGNGMTQSLYIQVTPTTDRKWAQKVGDMLASESPIDILSL